MAFSVWRRRVISGSGGWQTPQNRDVGLFGHELAVRVEVSLFARCCALKARYLPRPSRVIIGVLRPKNAPAVSHTYPVHADARLNAGTSLRPTLRRFLDPARRTSPGFAARRLLGDLHDPAASCPFFKQITLRVEFGNTCAASRSARIRTVAAQKLVAELDAERGGADRIVIRSMLKLPKSGRLSCSELRHASGVGDEWPLCMRPNKYP